MVIEVESDNCPDILDEMNWVLCMLLPNVHREYSMWLLCATCLTNSQLIIKAIIDCFNIWVVSGAMEI